MATPDHDQLIHLGTKDGQERWLDLSSGREFSRPVDPAQLHLALAVEALTERKLKFQRTVEDRLEAGFVDAAGGRLKLSICPDPKSHNLFVILRAACVVPNRRRAEAAEYLTRANWGMALGSFDMDWSDGEVVFRVSVHAPGASLTSRMVGRMVDCALWAMDRYGDGLERTIVGEAPAAVIAELEASA